jgi:hypothetical protein
MEGNGSSRPSVQFLSLLVSLPSPLRPLIGASIALAHLLSTEKETVKHLYE